jgi:N-acetylglutamate synthase-like GNAT family acetyltransferase
MIRKATINDLDEIINLNKLLFELEYNNFDNTLDINWPTSREGRGYFIDAINKDITLVCEMDNRVVGYLTGTLNTEYSYNTIKQAELNNMCVLQEYRNKGIGRELYNEFWRGYSMCAKFSLEHLQKLTGSDKE